MVRIRLSFGSEKPHSLCAQMRYSALLSSSLGTQRFAALGAAAGKHCTTILGGHAGTEAMSAGAAHLARLICSFHLKFSCGQIDFSAIKGLCPIEICSMKWVLGISPPNKELFPYTPKTPSSRCRLHSSSAGKVSPEGVIPGQKTKAIPCTIAKNTNIVEKIAGPCPWKQKPITRVFLTREGLSGENYGKWRLFAHG